MWILICKGKRILEKYFVDVKFVICKGDRVLDLALVEFDGVWLGLILMHKAYALVLRRFCLCLHIIFWGEKGAWTILKGKKGLN